MPAAERASALRAAAESIRAAAEELAELNVRETGKLRPDALGGIDAGAGTLTQYAELGPLHGGRTLQGDWSATDLMIPEPRGVVAVLTPWNDPVAVAAGLLGAALVTGNTVVHKPSERCPRTGRRFAELLAEHLPDARIRPLEATFLAWLDLRAYGVDDPAERALDKGRVRLEAGHRYQPGLTGHVRLNIATSAERLREIVRRLAASLMA
jgi:hypothetical protein